MLKVGEGKLVRKVLHCMALKSTLRMICTLSSSNIILSQPIPTMNLCTKWTNGNFTTSLVELSWLTIHAGLHFSRTFMRPKYLFQNCCKKKLIIMQTKSSNCNKAVLHVCGSQNWLARSKNNFPAPSFLSVRALHHWGFSSLLVSSISWYVSGSIIFNIHMQFHLTSVVLSI